LVKIQERQPVAIAYQNHQSGYIDQEGVFIAKSFYEKNPQQLPAFSLKVFGYGPQYQQYWPEVYNLIQDFPVKVSEINWQNPSNLVLTTELGKVYLGAISPQFGRQLKQLEQLRSLSSYIPLSEIVYIDLSNLEVPTVQLKQKSEKKSLNSLVRKQ
jgi:cell division protein FtsQ